MRRISSQIRFASLARRVTPSTLAASRKMARLVPVSSPGCRLCSIVVLSRKSLRPAHPTGVNRPVAFVSALRLRSRALSRWRESRRTSAYPSCVNKRQIATAISFPLRWTATAGPLTRVRPPPIRRNVHGPPQVAITCRLWSISLHVTSHGYRHNASSRRHVRAFAVAAGAGRRVDEIKRQPCRVTKCHIQSVSLVPAACSRLSRGAYSLRVSGYAVTPTIPDVDRDGYHRVEVALNLNGATVLSETGERRMLALEDGAFSTSRWVSVPASV
jgi:hypothetical protein